MTLTRRQALLSTSALGVASLLPRGVFAQGEPARGGVVSVHVNAEQRILNPSLRASTGVYVMTSKMVESLVDLDGEGRPIGVLATGWESSEDGRTITFTLRQGVRWHDGTPFTSADVRYTALEMWKTQLNYSTQLQHYLDAVDTPDEHTVIFRYSRPMPLPLLLRALVDLGYVAPRHIFEGTNVLENPANTAPIGTGPFRFVEYQRGQYVIAERNPDYWREGFPFLDRIVWRIINDRAAAAAAIESGEIQFSPFSSLSLADMDRLAQDDRFDVGTRGNEANAVFNTIEFNCRHEALKDVRVRQAIAHAVDVDFFCENFLYGFGKPATGPIPSSSPDFYPEGEPPYTFDLDRAEELLDEAGFPRDDDDQRFSLRLMPTVAGEDVPLFATFIQQSLAELGITVEIIQYDAAGFLARTYRDWDFDLATGWHQYRGDPAVSTTVWYRSGSPRGAPWTNQFGWQSDRIDALIDDAASELDPVRRKELYAQFVQEANAEIPVWMAIERQFISVTNRTLVNAGNTPRWGSSDWHDLWVRS